MNSKLFVLYLVSAWALQVSGLALEEPGSRRIPVYPRVKLVNGQVTSERLAGKAEKVKLKDVLIERALLKVGPKSQVHIELDAHSSLFISENAVVEIPVITWGESDIPEIKIERGRVFYECAKSCRRFITTPLSREIFNNGESWLEYVPESPRVELLVLHGKQEFKGLETEEIVTLTQGQKVVFQGLKEAGEVAYDNLLKGRKVARGKLMPVVTLSESDFKALEREYEVKRKALSAPPPKPKRSPKQICEKPFAELNQCVWSAKKNAKTPCLRRRCNANGMWVDPQESIACESKEKVGPCDY